MDWIIQKPTDVPLPGEEICLTITGGPSGEQPRVFLRVDGKEPIELNPVAAHGGGFVVCFTLPSDYDSARISASSRGAGPNVLGL